MPSRLREDEVLASLSLDPALDPGPSNALKPASPEDILGKATRLLERQDNNAGAPVTVEERREHADELARLYVANTPYSVEAANLFEKLMDAETLAYARNNDKALPAAFSNEEIIDLSNVKIIDSRASSNKVTREWMIFEDELGRRYRAKNGYDNRGIAQEISGAGVTAMAAEDVPLAKLARNGHKARDVDNEPVFSFEHRADYEVHKENPANFLIFASPMMDDFADLGDLTSSDPGGQTHNRIRDLIGSERGEKGLKSLGDALKRYSAAEAAENTLSPAEKKENGRRQPVIAEQVWRIQQELHRLETHRGRLSTAKTRDEDAINSVKDESKQLTIALNAVLGEEEKLWAKWRDPWREKHRASMTIAKLLPDYLQERLTQFHVASIPSANVDEFNPSLCNVGFRGLNTGPAEKARVAGVDGNYLLAGFGGRQKEQSIRSVNVRARPDNPLPVNFVRAEDLNPHRLPVTSTDIGAIPRSTPFAELFAKSIKAETSLVADGLWPQSGLRFYVDELRPHFFAAYKQSLIPPLADLRWMERTTPEATGEVGRLFPPLNDGKDRHDRVYSAQQLADIVSKRRAAIAQKYQGKAMDIWKKKYPEDVARAHREVAAATAGLTGVYIDPRPAPVATAEEPTPLPRRM